MMCVLQICVAVGVIFFVKYLDYPKRLLLLYVGLGGLMAMLCVIGYVGRNKVSSAANKGTVPTSIRENPSSYRPVSVTHTGYHVFTAISYTGSGAAVPSTTYSSGGYSGGK